MGKHLRDLGSNHDWKKAHMYQAMAGVPNLISVTAGKISISIFLVQTLGPAVTTFQLYFLKAMIVLTVVFNILGMVVSIDFAMTPTEVLQNGVSGYFLSCQVHELFVIAGSG